ncbi:MAG: hypothetical protein COU47_01920 [Candidatus Niyogibacteria bacterium CG10_big_fil_rev_8_21_14_0_10_46_36]|uniref:Glycosyl transferase family 1 domain-containing protein n=1 Tax=Candidatus Niyogibacteria bacterium CG10_big_fil_rev_8_21_14_0_10_46_36 TaxID=1974726 RepID=A0A2H0TDM7_9BACT|nr:MAG: hypothetical protein COU47_01920 [Candidatus Niyogibacteria bacterium CG10_big_fil_rev_8_21_14_0_10_46_36]
MKVLVIGSDRKLFEEGSDVRGRIIEYGSLFEELHIIVFSTTRLQKQRIAPNVWIYPTNSRSRFFYSIDAVHLGKQVCRKARFDRAADIISTQDPFEAGLSGWLLKRASGIPLQMQVHTDFLSPYFGKESALNRIRVRIATFLLPRADGIRVVSERIRQSILPIVGEHRNAIFVLPIFTDTAAFEHASRVSDMRAEFPDGSFVLFMASRLTPEKNIHMAIQALRDPCIREYDICLYIIGEGPQKDMLTQEISAYGLDKRVRIKEWTSAVASYYTSADAFVLTSDYEGYGRTAIEAMAAGVPVIMTNVGVAGELLLHEENGIVIPVRDTKALARAIRELYEDPEKRKRIIKAAHDTIQHLSQTTHAEYLHAYKQSLERCLQ